MEQRDQAERPEVAPHSPELDRRGVLARTLSLAAGAGLLAGCGRSGGSEAGDEPDAGVGGFPEDLDPEHFVNHGTEPLTLETKRALLDGLITPTERIFVRNNQGPPAGDPCADPDAWEVEFTGVGAPRTLTVGDLKGLGCETVAAVLQCSGNGRRFFEHGASGSQWGVGAAANVLWTGVPLRDVVAELGGAADGARFATALGGDALSPALDPSRESIERSVPLADAMDRALLAWDMNGAPLGLHHGGPLRLVVPGYYGVNQVKFTKRVALTPEESPMRIMTNSYRVRPIGASSDPSQPSMWRMNVKSWITSPLEDRAAGAQYVTGVAFSGEAPVTGVEVSADGGTTWQLADFLGPDLGPHAWRTFSMKWDAPAGTHTLVCRATDGTGTVQPKERVENERGYAHNGWSDPGVVVKVS